LELLEDRQLLSVTVTTLADESDGSIADGDISLRDAIAAAPSGETINFAVTGTINLTLGELIIQRNLTINGPGADLLTLDASGSDPEPDDNSGDGSRVIEIDDGDSETLQSIAISGVSLTGGDVDDGGGAIQCSENLSVTASTISGNAAHKGGGIYSYSGAVTVSDSVISGNVGGGIFNYGEGDLTVIASTISGNSAEIGGGIYGYYGSVTVSNSTISGNSAADRGGGIYAPHVTVTGSTISGNSAGAGGGIYGGYVSVTNSTISGNSAADRGGGIYNYGDMTVTSSTISGNSADTGGGIYSSTDLTGVTTSIQNSTISGNIASSAGGGLFNYSGLAVIDFSTITLNQAPAGTGGGVASYGDSSTRTRVRSSIVAGNVGSDVDFVFGGTNSFLSNGYNLIGAGNALGRFNQTGDQTASANPQLAPLAHNGGATKTHALLAGSPAIDRGNPSAVAGSAGVPAFDQRGVPYGRVYDGDGTGSARIDIGAFEFQTLAAPAMPGDYNKSNNVDAADYVLWRKTMGSNVAAYTGADGSGNGVIDQADYDVWKANFGKSRSAPTVDSGARAVVALSKQVTEKQTLSEHSVATSRPDFVSRRTPVKGPISPAALAGVSRKTAQQVAAIDLALNDTLLVLQLVRPAAADKLIAYGNDRQPGSNHPADRLRPLCADWSLFPPAIAHRRAT
jgi:predicted outer membrane repeat protein